MVHVIARMEILPGCMDKFMEVMTATAKLVREEDGCIRYIPCVDVNPAEGPRYITIVECWESEAHLKAHAASAHMGDFRAKVKTLRANSVVNVVTPAEK